MLLAVLMPKCIHQFECIWVSKNLNIVVSVLKIAYQALNKILKLSRALTQIYVLILTNALVME